MGASNTTEWNIQLINSRTGSIIDDDSGVCNVLTAASPVEITIYSLHCTPGSCPLFNNSFITSAKSLASFKVHDCLQ